MTRLLFFWPFLVLGLASAQNLDQTYKGPIPYEYSKGLTDAQKAQLKAKMDALLVPPRLTGTTLRAAVTAVLNEHARIDALIGELPRDLAEALNRAAIRIPVQAVLSRAAAPNSGALSRVKRLLVSTSARETIIATSTAVLRLQGGRVQVYESPYLAAQVRQGVQGVFQQAAKKP